MENIKNLSKTEMLEAEVQRAKEAFEGVGRFTFRCRKSEVILPKKTLDGKITIKSGEVFEGDSYFFQLVKTGDLTFVGEVKTQPQKEDVMEEKLILDQPDSFDSEGIVEYTKDSKTKKPKKESKKEKKEESDDHLIVEVPDYGDLEVLNEGCGFVIID